MEERLRLLVLVERGPVQHLRRIGDELLISGAPRLHIGTGLSGLKGRRQAQSQFSLEILSLRDFAGPSQSSKVLRRDLLPIGDAVLFLRDLLQCRISRRRTEIEEAIFATDELQLAGNHALALRNGRPIILFEMLLSLLKARAVQLPAGLT